MYIKYLDFFGAPSGENKKVEESDSFYICFHYMHYSLINAATQFLVVTLFEASIYFLLFYFFL